MSEVWYSSDFHLGHKLAATLRGFDSPQAHDAAIAAMWRDQVSKDDTVWILGDLTLQNPARVIDYLNGLPGRKHLVLGNHDYGHPCMSGHHTKQRIYFEAFESVQIAGRRKIAGRDVLLSHFPYAGDHTREDRFNQWRLRDEGEWLLHGHTHKAERHEGPHQLHVGLDAWGLRLVPQSEVEAQISRISDNTPVLTS